MSESLLRHIRCAQRITGLMFLAFLLMHLVNTAAAIFGPAAYNDVQRLTRSVYQHPVYEPLLLFTPLVVHIGLGAWRIRNACAPSRTGGMLRRLNRFVCLFLVAIVVGHVVATRGPSLVYGIYPGFEGVAFTFQWAPAYFYPYYALFAAAAIFHASFGLCTMLGSAAGSPRSRQFAVFAAPVAAWMVIVVALLALGGQLFTVDDASHTEFAKLLLEVLS